MLTNSHCDDTKHILQKQQQKSADNYNRTKVDNVKNYVSGQNVVYGNGYDNKTWQSGVILSCHECSERFYNILNRSGHVIRRNIKFLLPDNTNRKFTVMLQNWPKVPILTVDKPQEIVPEKSPVLRRSARLAEKWQKYLNHKDHIVIYCSKCKVLRLFGFLYNLFVFNMLITFHK